MTFVGVAAVLALVLVIALLMVHIRTLQGEVAHLHERVWQEVSKSADRERATVLSVGKATADTVETITQAVERQAKLMQEGMQTVWAPQQPATPAPMSGNPGVDRILAKYGINPGGYNLPTPDGVVDHDFLDDPTDRFLQEPMEQRHMGAAMVPTGVESVENPTGIEGFKAGW